MPPAVGIVAQERVAEVRKVDADLVGAASVQPAADERGAFAKHLLDGPVGVRRLAACAGDDGQWHAHDGGAAKGLADGAGTERGRALHEGEVFLGDSALGKKFDEG